MQNKIRYLRNNEIDKTKWDKCIEFAYQSLIYGYSWYLDITAPGWGALVLGDYEAVMPLPLKSKGKVLYAYQPFYTQQLGVYSQMDRVDVSLFVEHLPQKIKYLNLNLNETNTADIGLVRENMNYILDISRDYESVSASYNRNCRRNLKKSYQVKRNEVRDISPKVFSRFIESNLDDQIKRIGKVEYELLERLCTILINKGKGEIVALKDEKDEIHAAGLYIFSNDRLIFSTCASSPHGKSNQAMYRIVDSQIKKYAGKFKWYDFSGSNIKGIAYFNSTFGARPVTYPTIKINRLPWPFRLLKK